jgi:hypothetical protein
MSSSASKPAPAPRLAGEAANQEWQCEKSGLKKLQMEQFVLVSGMIDYLSIA